METGRIVANRPIDFSVLKLFHPTKINIKINALVNAVRQICFAYKDGKLNDDTLNNYHLIPTRK